MLYLFAAISYAGTFFLLRKLTAGSTFKVVCATVFLSPLMFFISVALVEAVTNKGSGLAAGSVMIFAMLLSAVALLALFVRGIVGWARLGVRAVGQSQSPPSSTLCSQCHHELTMHKLGPTSPPCSVCMVDGCECRVFLPSSPGALQR